MRRPLGEGGAGIGLEIGGLKGIGPKPGALRARRLSARRGGSGVLAYANSRAGGHFPPSLSKSHK